MVARFPILCQNLLYIFDYNESNEMTLSSGLDRIRYLAEPELFPYIEILLSWASLHYQVLARWLLSLTRRRQRFSLLPESRCPHLLRERRCTTTCGGRQRSNHSAPVAGELPVNVYVNSGSSHSERAHEGWGGQYDMQFG